MKKRIVIIITVIIILLVGIVWFIVDYNQRVEQAQKQAAEFEQQMKYPWRYREIKTSDDLTHVYICLLYTSPSPRDS